MGVVPSGCDYAEARFVELRTERLGVRNGAVDHVEHDASAGLGVRARVGGAWGFAGTTSLTAEGARPARAPPPKPPAPRWPARSRSPRRSRAGKGARGPPSSPPSRRRAAIGA